MAAIGRGPLCMCSGQLADLYCEVNTEYIYSCISITGPVTTCRPTTKLDTEFDVNKISWDFWHGILSTVITTLSGSCPIKGMVPYSGNKNDFCLMETRTTILLDTVRRATGGQLADLCLWGKLNIYVCISITGPVTTYNVLATKLDTEFDVNKSRARSPCCPSSLYF
jgi:hypothetical protein